MKLKIYQGKAGSGKGKWRWKLVARNGKIVANGGEGYVKRKALLDELDRIYRFFSELDWQALEKAEK